MSARAAEFDIIAFDADDTLWENEALFRKTQDRFTGLLKDHVNPDHLLERLLATERRNLSIYGFGIKGFILSFIEAAIEATDGQLNPNHIKQLINAGQEMLTQPIELLEHVETTLNILAPNFTLLLITKGDLLDQQRKISASGLEPFFNTSHIVSAKDPSTYEAIFAQHKVAPSRIMMVGNSMKSDVIPPIKAGAWGTHLPHTLTWDIEKATPPLSHPRYNECAKISDIPALISSLQGAINT